MNSREGSYAGPRFSKLNVGIRAVRCLNRCRHCYAGVGTTAFAGRPSAADVLGIVQKLSRLCTRKKGVSLCLYDDPFDHPEIETIIAGLWEKGFTSCTSIWATHGAGMLHWDDLSCRLRKLKTYGVDIFQFTFHGMEEEHDWFARREGAFGDTVRVAELCLEAGFTVYWAVFLSKRNLGDIPELVTLLDKISLGKKSTLLLSTWTYIGNAVEVENLRPSIDQYETLRPAIGARLPTPHTESYWVERGLAGDLSGFPQGSSSSACLSVSETGSITHALSDDDVEIGCLDGPLELTVARYLRTRSTCHDICDKRDRIALQVLAREYGNPTSNKIHTSVSMLRCWIGRQSSEC